MDQRGRLPRHPLGVEIIQEPGGEIVWRRFCNFLGTAQGGLHQAINPLEEISKGKPSYSPKIQSSGLCFCTDLVRRQGPWTPVMSLASIGHAANPESAARDRRRVLLDRTSLTQPEVQELSATQGKVLRYGSHLLKP
ncbi:hypothetical protein Taro_007030 [Colocasia esculenta]|uniref:Uncharacterized protein n=1 Tax=Colocasia esculenta TaxID=4460 RepID=A0A843TSX2_COLES|nr:hypothetical protein [Colocasia esculenta]